MSIAAILSEVGENTATENTQVFIENVPNHVDMLLSSTASQDAETTYIFVESLLKQASWQIARTLTLECGDDFHRIVANIRAIKLRMSEAFHDEVANHVFGQKLAGDLGIRSTQGHPKTDYGEPRFGSGWDLDER